MNNTPQGQGPGTFALPDVRADLLAKPGQGQRPDIFTVCLAAPENVPPDVAVRYAAEWLQTRAPNVDGTVSPSTGFGQWGVEHGVTVRVATVRGAEFQWAIRALLRQWGQECAYAETLRGRDGRTVAEEWPVDAPAVPLAGFRGTA